MKEITLKIPDKEFPFFMKLVKNLGFVEVSQPKSEDSDADIIENLKRGFEDMKEIRQGKRKVTPLKDFLDEL
jgi:hypothetical protein